MNPTTVTRTLFAVLAGAALSSLPRSAEAADEKAACVAAYEQTQRLRSQNKLRAARDEVLLCARAVCPKLVRVDCSRWVDEVTASLPTLVFAARDASGRDRTGVRVSIDGDAVSAELGQEVPVDPGTHAIRFEADGLEPVQEEVVVRAGEKSRLVAATLREPAVAQARPADPEPLAPAAPRDESRPMPVLVPVLGGLGLVAVGGGAFLAVTASSQLDDLRAKCAPHCEQADVDTLNLRYQLAAISAGVGAIGIGAAIWMFVTRPASPKQVGVTAVDVSASGLSLSGRF